MQLPLGYSVPESSWKPTPVAELPSWTGARRIAIDVETCDPQLKKLGPGVRRGGYIVGVSFAIEDGPAHYLPFRHDGGDNLDEDHVLNYLHDQAKAFRGELVGANLPYDGDFLAEEGITFWDCSWHDVKIAESLIYEHYWDYSLEGIASRRGLPGKDESLLRATADAYGVDPKADLWRLPARFVGAYGEQDVRLPLAVLREQEKDIEKQNLHEVWALEREVTPVLIKMTRRGVPVNINRVLELEQEKAAEAAAHMEEFRKLTGFAVLPGDVMKARVLAPALQALGVPLSKTANGQWQIDKKLLNSIDHPAITHLKAARQIYKLQNTYIDPTKAHLVRGRIHGTYNQLRCVGKDDEDDLVGTRSGRLSMNHTNLQQQIKRDKVLAKRWRGVFIPDPGETWGSLDYSQQETRILVHFAEICGLPQAREIGDKYRTDPNFDLHAFVASISGGILTRDESKHVNHGLSYGMGGAKLCREWLHLPTKSVTRMDGTKVVVAGEEGQRMIDSFNHTLPYVKILAQLTEKAARTRGYIKTLIGRVCRFQQDEEGNYQRTYKAINKLIQGGAASQAKKALVEVERANLCPRLPVHDEFNFSFSNPEKQSQEAMIIMRDCVTLRVPNKVDVGLGPSWGEAK